MDSFSSKFEIASELKKFGHQIGLDALGITMASTPTNFAQYEDWVSRGFSATMTYLQNPSKIEKRKRMELLLPGVQSLIVGAISYHPSKNEHASDAKFGRFSWGQDYHLVMKKKLQELVLWLSSNVKKPFQTAIYVDTGPVLEKSLAERAGMGWIGKNTCVIHPTLGSYFVLGEILTTLSLPPDNPIPSQCGSCQRCVDLCPTQAFIQPYVLNANLCLAYHTLENQEETLPKKIQAQLHGWVAGCDICQEVCPWNAKGQPSRLPEMAPQDHLRLSLAELSSLTNEEHQKLFSSTTLSRLKPKQMKRNAQTNLENMKTTKKIS